MGKILDLTRPRMGALWHLDLTPGVDSVFDEINASYHGTVTATQNLTIFNVTQDAVTARQAKVNDAAPPVHGPSQTRPVLDAQPPPGMVDRSAPGPLTRTRSPYMRGRFGKR